MSKSLVFDLAPLLKVQVLDVNGVKKDYEIRVREFTKQERKEKEKEFKDFNNLTKKLAKLSQKLPLLKERLELAKDKENNKEREKYLDEYERLIAEIDKLSEKFEKIGGDDFLESKAKERFDKCISGSDKEKVREVAETIGYGEFFKKLEDMKKEKEKESKKK